MKYCMGCMEPIDDSVIVCHLCGYNNDVSAAAPLFIKPGSILANRYIVGKNISYDKTTAVYIAHDAFESGKVLVKEFLPEKYVSGRNKDTGDVLVMSPQYEAFDKERSAFQFHEKKIKTVVENDAVLKCLEVVEDMNTVYAVCSYAGGITLTEHIKRNGKYSEEGAINALLGVMHGVDKLHENDIKLGNITTDSIFVTEKGELKLWKYEPVWENSGKAADAAKFGKKKVIPLNEYAAPEAVESVGQITIRSDVYSIAAVLYHMMCGTPPASAAKRLKRFNKKGKDLLRSPKKFIHDVKPDHENALLKALALSPDNRTKDIECLISELTSGVSIKRIKEKSGLPFFSRIPLFVKLIVPLVFVAAIVVGQVYAHRKSDMIKPDNVAPVPDVVSWDSSIAANQLRRKGFTMQVTGVTATDQDNTGTVLTQDPPSGSIMPQNTPVYVTVAKYSDMIDMPFVRGGDAEVCKKRLEAMGFIVEMKEGQDDVIAPGCVMEQEPAAIVDGKYNRVAYGSRVTLTKSTGRKNMVKDDKVPVVNYTNMSFDDAYAEALKNNTLLKVTEFRFAEEPLTQVLEQNPQPKSDYIGVDVPIELVVSKGYNEFDMPDVTYMTKEQAEGLLSEYSLKLTIDEEPNPTVAAGLIFKQSVPAGFTIKPNWEVRLTLSTGAEQVNMINVVGMQKNDAVRALSELGLGAEISYTNSEKESDEDKVIEQDPKQGTSIAKGSKIKITVSTGAELIQVPNVINKPESEAKKILTDAGFKTDSRSGKGDQTIGSIMSQSPEPGQKLKKGETVSIVVCSGGQITTMVQTTTTPTETTTTTTTVKDEFGLTSWVDGHIKALRLQPGQNGKDGQNAFVADSPENVPSDPEIYVHGDSNDGKKTGDIWTQPYIFTFVYNSDQTAVYLAAYYGNSSFVEVPDSIPGENGKSIPVIGICEQAFTLKADLVTTIKIHSIKSVQYEICDLAFAQCKALVSVELPDTTVRIGNGAFQGCSTLPTLIIPESVTEIGEQAFVDCINMSTIAIPSKVTVIKHSAFKGCRTLINITLPAGLTEIESHAFVGCASLRTLNLPSASVKLNDFAYGYDEDLEPYPGVEIKLPDGTTEKLKFS